jgi:endonuclease/exonuclease/phosphatase family metal-dependent hydrolase
MIRFSAIFLFIGFLLCNQLASQVNHYDDYRLMFYNVENLFDTIDNPDTNDEEFLAKGKKHWNNYKYWRKINKLFQVVAAAGSTHPPDIIGLCEVEGFLPLYHLTNNTPLSKYSYSILHRDSPDKRGIDVALLVNRNHVGVIETKFYRVSFPWDTASTTREILYAALKIQDDTLHTFVNHWPSRRGGQLKSEPRRIEAAKVLMMAIDSLCINNSDAKIVVMGDFNDEPSNKSLSQLVGSTDLINLSGKLKSDCRCGSYKYKSEWNMIDQVLISESLLGNNKLTYKPASISIFRDDFLLQEDETYGGFKPYRTFLGPRYLGGFSDHLPVTLELIYQVIE